MKIRFHLDEHIDPTIADGLRRQGVDVTTTIDAALRTKPDESHLDFARREGRVIVTCDQDFLRLHAGGQPHSGIVFVPPGNVSVSSAIALLLLVEGCMSAEELINHVEFLST